MFCDQHNLRRKLPAAHLVIGAVLVEGSRTPLVISEEMVKMMQPGAVIVDVAVDQGGCVETIRPTSHGEPTYIAHGVVHYGVTNIPGVVPRTSTLALTNATIPYALEIADLGWQAAAARNPVILSGIDICGGSVANKAVAGAFGLEFLPPADAIGRCQRVRR